MELVVPVVSLTGADGRLDVHATRDYARAFAEWSPVPTALLCGSTGRGDSLPATVREQVFAVWADVLPVERLLCCAWGAVEAAALAGRGLRVLLALPGPIPVTELAALIGGLGGAVSLYSHPRFGWQVTAGILNELRGHGAEPTGLKLSKCSLGELAACRRAGSPGLTLWDGSARHVRASVAAGADGVVAACLAALPGHGPDRPVGPDDVQRSADPILAALDRFPDRARRLGWLAAQVRTRLRTREIRCSG